MILVRCLFIFIVLSYSVLPKSKVKMVKIKSGSYVPLYGVKGKKVYVKTFYMDVYPVTNSQYLEFIKQNPKWQKGNTIQLFTDKNYLSSWKSNDQLGNLDKQSPITNVSWFAAKSYCSWKNKRLPTVDEWEFVAMASRTKSDARKDDEYNKMILAGYEEPKTHLKKVEDTKANYWKVKGLHGLVWEWVHDFNSVLISGESRKDGQTDRNLFCASGSINSTDLMNYAAFMRYAFRGSLKANYTIQTLGFRCASDKNL